MMTAKEFIEKTTTTKFNKQNRAIIDFETLRDMLEDFSKIQMNHHRRNTPPQIREKVVHRHHYHGGGDRLGFDSSGY